MQKTLAPSGLAFLRLYKNFRTHAFPSVSLDQNVS